MFTRFLFAGCLSLMFFFAGAQVKNKAYTIHKVREGETFRSIAAFYNLDARQLASYNNLEYYADELAAKTLRIPKKNKKGSSDDAKSTATIKSQQSSQRPSKSGQSAEVANTNSVIKLTDSLGQTTDVENEPPTLLSDINKNLPVILFIGGSLVLLSFAIIYYRFVSRK